MDTEKDTVIMIVDGDSASGARCRLRREVAVIGSTFGGKFDFLVGGGSSDGAVLVSLGNERKFYHKLGPPPVSTIAS
jgi:hypothetical protein